MRVLLLDAGKEPLATFGDRLSQGGPGAGALGVELRMGARVTEVDGEGVESIEDEPGRPSVTPPRHGDLGRRRAGVAAGPMLGEATGAGSTGPGGSRSCPTSPCPAIPRCSPSATWLAHQLPGVAEVAMQGGIHAANTIIRRLHGDDESRRSSTATWAASPHRPLPGGLSVGGCG